MVFLLLMNSSAIALKTDMGPSFILELINVIFFNQSRLDWSASTFCECTSLLLLAECRSPIL